MIFREVVGPSSCKPPPWGTPSTIAATASLKSRRLMPCRSNLTGKTLRSSSLYRGASTWGTLTTKHPSLPPPTSGIRALLPRDTYPAGRGAGSTQTMSPLRRPPASSAATQQSARPTTPGTPGGATTAAAAAMGAPPKTPGMARGRGGAGAGATWGCRGGARGGKPLATRSALASNLPACICCAKNWGDMSWNP